ncbi:NAD-dependent protein deacetylase sirtuin-3, mitochondrial-like isoform X3 [Pseudophryne corroboree]|uniref:NAD-dependent protein deacetylase sirtuin-3, mitochondrial-like isoform X3 n=1 Tax=Pseudophryne corroboree TaxID=495146 RepID=UPI0030817297
MAHSSSDRSSSIKTRGQKLGAAKSATNISQPPEELLTKKMNKLSVAEDQNHTRKSQLAKLGLGKKYPGSPPLPLKCSSLEDIAELILKNRCKKIIVMAGAGISTQSGIPDFRTPGSGLYDNMQRYNVPYPEAIFDIDYFTHNPKPFFALAKELYPGKYKPNVVHYFVRLLHDKGLLLRCYTQNIDGLERTAGIPPKKLVEAHGTFSSASCHLCYTPFPTAEARIEPFANIVNSVRPNVPRLLMNRDAVGPFKTKPMKSTDVVQLGELCDVTRKFLKALNWQTDMEEVMQSQKIIKCDGHIRAAVQDAQSDFSNITNVVQLF